MIFNIQFLRAVAALSVAYFHSDFEGWRFGSFGVDIFFVISGFIMAYICQEDPNNFFWRRLIRIVPLYWVLTFIIFALAAFAPSLVHRATYDLADLARSLLFIPYRNKSGLLQPELFLGWTLNYEMFFYLNVALALLVVPARFAAGLAAVLIGGIWAAIKLSRCTASICEFYGNPIVFEFIFGILAYRIYVQMPQRVAVRTVILWLALVVVLFISIIAVNVSSIDGPLISLPSYLHAREWPYLGVIAFGVVVAAVISESGGVKLTWQWPLQLGGASYVIYLIHPYVALGFSRVVSLWVTELTTRTILGLVIYFGIVISFSVMIHVVVERRILKLGRYYLAKK